jgi:hypothetical protein
MNQREKEKTPISTQNVRQEEIQELKSAEKETDENEQFFKAEIEKLEKDKTKLIEELNLVKLNSSANIIQNEKNNNNNLKASNIKSMNFDSIKLLEVKNI